jgi:hypothetical protein
LLFIGKVLFIMLLVVLVVDVVLGVKVSTI